MGWVRDDAHQPDPFYLQYILTGDYFYLEQLQQWAGFYAMSYCVGNTWCRGPWGQPIAGIVGQIRANAWIFRTRTNAAWASPDATPERQYFNDITDDAIAFFEGWKNITGTKYDGRVAKTWATTNVYVSASKVNPLHIMENNGNFADGPVNTTLCSATTSMWMNCTLLFSSYGSLLSQNLTICTVF